mgnify:CR=1 FL=1
MRIPDTFDFSQVLPASVAQGEMRRGERIIWADRAAKGSSARQAVSGAGFGVFFVAFSIIWMAFAFLLTGGRSSSSDIVFRLFPWFGLPFLATGVLMVVSPIWRIGLPRPVFALSNKRFLVISGKRGQNVRSYDLVNIADVQRTERADGSGSIVLGRRSGSGRDAIHGVPNVRRVVTELETQMLRAFEEEREARTPGAD